MARTEAEPIKATDSQRTENRPVWPEWDHAHLRLSHVARDTVCCVNTLHIKRSNIKVKRNGTDRYFTAILKTFNWLIHTRNKFCEPISKTRHHSDSSVWLVQLHLLHHYVKLKWNKGPQMHCLCIINISPHLLSPPSTLHCTAGERCIYDEVFEFLAIKEWMLTHPSIHTSTFLYV